jgi:glycosyltransferase involved in cell wall biosynthesis
MSALNDIRETRNIIVVCVGGGTIPREIKEKYQVLSLEWTDDEEILLKFYAACDVFLMPSLAESFGLMAIEAMAAECVVISFQNTVVQEITRAPEIGVSVQYKSSKELREKILYFKDNIKERMRRGYKGRELVKKNFSFKQYCEQHIELYRTIMKEKDNPTRGGSF